MFAAMTHYCVVFLVFNLPAKQLLVKLPGQLEVRCQQVMPDKLARLGLATGGFCDRNLCQLGPALRQLADIGAAAQKNCSCNQNSGKTR